MISGEYICNQSIIDTLSQRTNTNIVLPPLPNFEDYISEMNLSDLKVVDEVIETVTKGSFYGYQVLYFFIIRSKIHFLIEGIELNDITINQSFISRYNFVSLICVVRTCPVSGFSKKFRVLFPLVCFKLLFCLHSILNIYKKEVSTIIKPRFETDEGRKKPTKITKNRNRTGPDISFISI
jgi:hypothetical protein